MAIIREGLVLREDEQIGTFKLLPYPDESLVISFQAGMRVEHVLEHASENGMLVSLMITPNFVESEG